MRKVVPSIISLLHLCDESLFYIISRYIFYKLEEKNERDYAVRSFLEQHCFHYDFESLMCNFFCWYNFQKKNKIMKIDTPMLLKRNKQTKRRIDKYKIRWLSNEICYMDGTCAKNEGGHEGALRVTSQERKGRQSYKWTNLSDEFT